MVFKQVYRSLSSRFQRVASQREQEKGSRSDLLSASRGHLAGVPLDRVGTVMWQHDTHEESPDRRAEDIRRTPTQAGRLKSAQNWLHSLAAQSIPGVFVSKARRGEPKKRYTVTVKDAEIVPFFLTRPYWLQRRDDLWQRLDRLCVETGKDSLEGIRPSVSLCQTPTM